MQPSYALGPAQKADRERDRRNLRAHYPTLFPDENRTSAEIDNLNAKYDYQSAYATLQYTYGALR